MDLSKLRVTIPVFSRLASKSTLLGIAGLVATYTGYSVDPAHLDVYLTAVAAVSSVALVLLNELPSGAVATPVAVLPAVVGAQNVLAGTVTPADTLKAVSDLRSDLAAVVGAAKAVSP